MAFISTVIIPLSKLGHLNSLIGINRKINVRIKSKQRGNKTYVN